MPSFRPRRIKVNIDVFIFPEKYVKRIAVDKIVADTKVDREGVERYKRMMASRKKLKPIVVVKHPRRQLYAVLDGHHRFFAQLEYGKKRIDCAIAGDLSSFTFYLTKEGWFQPHPLVTKHLRAPIMDFQRKLRQNMKSYLSDFRRDPESIRKRFNDSMRERMSRLRKLRE